MVFNEMERGKEVKQVELQAKILFKLKESRRWLTGVSAQINGQLVANVITVQDKLDDMINKMEDIVARGQDALDKDNR